ncbi:phosphoserine phosphatase SerB [Myxococcota bacterium]|nr:phosphoserine phosphatase SerB [Myxococcota bacterium]
MSETQLLLVTVTGPDRPGITAGLAEVLAQDGVTLVDVEQTTTLRLLSLSILIALEPGPRSSVLKDLLFRARELGVHLDFQVVEPDEAVVRPLPSYAVTCIGDPLTASFLADLAGEAARCGLNIDRIARLTRGRLSCLELILRGENAVEVPRVRRALMGVGGRHAVNVAFQPEAFYRRSKRLVCFDMDSTLVRNEMIDELADLKGIKDEIGAITEAAMRGEIDFRDSLVARVERLAGLTEDDLGAAYARIEITPGARELIRALKGHGYRTAVVSGGFTWFTDRLRADLGLDYAHGTEVEVASGRMTGRIAGPIVDAARKAALVAEMAAREGIPLDQVVCIGDGANDLPMLEAAGLGIAFNAKPRVREAAQHALDWPDLSAVLFLLGLREVDGEPGGPDRGAAGG